MSFHSAFYCLSNSILLVNDSFSGSQGLLSFRYNFPAAVRTSWRSKDVHSCVLSGHPLLLRVRGACSRVRVCMSGIPYPLPLQCTRVHELTPFPLPLLTYEGDTLSSFPPVCLWRGHCTPLTLCMYSMQREPCSTPSPW